MTQENKSLLLKVLCELLPYEVKVAFYLYVIDEWKTTILRSINPSEGTYRIGNQDYNDWARIKPYLRPMSSMTEEEAKCLFLLHNEDRKECEILKVSIDKDYIVFEIDDGCCSFERHTIWFEDAVASIESLDWLNINHFDYRGLIPKGLAIAVTEENNPYK